MEIQLGIVERLLLPQILPNKGKIVQMQIVASIKELIKFSVEEIEDFELKDTNEGVSFNRAKDTAKTYIFAFAQYSEILDSLKRLDDESLVTESMLPLYSKFK